MAPDSKVGLLFWSWKETFAALRRPVVLLPFLIYAAVQLFLVAGLVFFMYPPFSFVFLPLLHWLGGEAALHYPNYFLGLPQAFDLLNLGLSGVLGIGVVGLATLLFTANERKTTLGMRIKSVRARYVHLFGAWLVETALSLVVIYGCAAWAAGSPDLAKYLSVARVLGVILVSALLGFTSVLIMLERQSFATAIVTSLRHCARYGVLAFVVVGLPSLLQLPIQFLLSKSAVIVQKLNPEIIVAVVSGGIFAGMISNFLIIGALTNLYRIIAFENENIPQPKKA